MSLMLDAHLHAFILLASNHASKSSFIKHQKPNHRGAHRDRKPVPKLASPCGCDHQLVSTVFHTSHVAQITIPCAPVHPMQPLLCCHAACIDACSCRVCVSLLHHGCHRCACDEGMQDVAAVIEPRKMVLAPGMACPAAPPVCCRVRCSVGGWGHSGRHSVQDTEGCFSGQVR